MNRIELSHKDVDGPKQIYKNRLIRPGRNTLMRVFAVTGIIGTFVLAGGAAHVYEENASLRGQLQTYYSENTTLKNEDQRRVNQALMLEINQIHTLYSQTVDAYEHLIQLRESSPDTSKHDQLFVDVLTLLRQQKIASASAALTQLSNAIDDTRNRNTSKGIPKQNAITSNTPPANGYSRQAVLIEENTFTVDMVAGDLGSTKVLVDTASDRDCANDCPALPLIEYVSRNSAYAGINGSYFCPAEYPSCSDKKNSSDTLLMNKHKTYFNSDNNKFSVVPLVVFLNGSMRFVSKSHDWGRDSSPDSLIANQPLLVLGGSVVFKGDGDPKKGNRGSRSFIAHKGTTAYIGVVHGVTLAESAKVLQALGFENALNLDSGGSTALWFNGYKVGPGRNIPNAILFVRK